jgi:hypothetical protein
MWECIGKDLGLSRETQLEENVCLGKRNVRMHAVIDLGLAGSLISTSLTACQSSPCASDRVNVLDIVGLDV